MRSNKVCHYKDYVVGTSDYMFYFSGQCTKIAPLPYEVHSNIKFPVHVLYSFCKCTYSCCQFCHLSLAKNIVCEAIMSLLSFPNVSLGSCL